MPFELTVFELTVELLPVPANRVDASGEFSTGLLQASIDHGALSYILVIIELSKRACWVETKEMKQQQ